MKKEETITELLGTTQNETAMFLNINRSQWSMFVSGKRDLPLEAKEQLAELLTHIQSAKAKNTENLLASQKNETKERLEALLKENQYQQMRNDKKVNRLEKKQQAKEAAMHLVQYFENHPNKKTTFTEKVVQSIQTRTKKDKQQKVLPDLVTQQIKQQVLQYEASLLKAALEKLA
ncbi:hypothetical protein [Flavobacterium sp. N1994]|uniref:hypothetical protein n=1 Tax=Flavobacterium sp. N1994 TaxID=2986827 RepID=UPI002223396C|nr:hypothetical protein [Flavobacterium sp. N1994]